MEDTNNGYLSLGKDGFLDYRKVALDPNPTFPPFQFEVLDWEAIVRWMYQLWWIPHLTGLFYILIIFSLQSLMKDRKPFHLQRPLFLWNLTLGIFSIFGFFRIAPQFIQEMFSSSGGIYSTLCHGTTRNEQTAFWLVLFVYSKFVELGDTLFIVLRKKPLVFLQWYHHFFTLIACWSVAPYIEPINTLFAVMNYGVHSLMYPYFALRAINIRIPRKVANIITTLQFAQMVLALVANVVTAGFYYAGTGCQRHPAPMRLAFFGYTTFVFLFFDLWNTSKKRVD